MRRLLGDIKMHLPARHTRVVRVLASAVEMNAGCAPCMHASCTQILQHDGHVAYLLTCLLTTLTLLLTYFLLRYLLAHVFARLQTS